MPTLKSEFVDVAYDIIGMEFADFGENTVITKTTGWDNATQAPTTTTTALPTIVLEFESSQVDGTLVKVGDYMLAGEYALLGFEPSPDNCTTTRDGVTAEVKRVIVHAKAAVIMQVRPL